MVAGSLLASAVHSQVVQDTERSSTSTGNTEAKPEVIEIIGAHLKSARIELSPEVGTTVYTLDQHMIDARLGH